MNYDNLENAVYGIYLRQFATYILLAINIADTEGTGQFPSNYGV